MTALTLILSYDQVSKRGVMATLALGGHSMALRFQDRPDEIERDVSATKKVYRWILILGFALCAAIGGVIAWVSGKSLRSYEEFIADGAICFWVVWVVTPFFQLLHKRTKEILGIVTDLEKSISTIGKDQARLVERLDTIQAEMVSAKNRN